MFVVLQEAVSTGDPELVQVVLQYRDFRRATERLAGIPELLSKLRKVKLTQMFGINAHYHNRHHHSLHFVLCITGSRFLCGDEMGVY